MEASCFVKTIAVQALFHPNSTAFWLGLASGFVCYETWMGDSNPVAVDFVINEAQVPPGLWMCFPAQLTCLGGRKECRICEQELGVVLGSEKGSSALDTIVFSVQVWLVSVPCGPVIHESREKHGATESPSLQIYVLPPGSSHPSYQSNGEKTEANMAKKSLIGSQLLCKGWTLWCMLWL